MRKKTSNKKTPTAAKAKRAGTRRGPRNLVCAFASPATIESAGTIELVKGRGVFVWDSKGRKFIDGLSSLWNCNIGHGQKEVGDAIAAQTKRIAFAPTLLGFSSQPARALATRIAKLAPKGMKRVAFTSGGSEANESVIRLVRLYWRLRGKKNKYKMVALNRAYHGSSTGAASLTGIPNFHEHYEPLMPGVHRIPRPYCYRCELKKTFPSCRLACANELEKLIKREGAGTIAAIIAEPVQGVGGVIVPPEGYFQRIREICDKYSVLLIADEVITGFGRTGKKFGIEHWGVSPDMISFAKGVSSGYLPLGGVIIREEIFQTLIDAGPDFGLHHGFTYSGHPVVCAAAIANLDIIKRDGLVARVNKFSAYFAKRLHSLSRHPIVGDVRSIGLMGAVEFVRDRKTKEPFPPTAAVPQRIRAACLERGVILRASADNVAVCPPFVIKRSELDRLLDVLDEAIREVGGEMAAPSAAPSPPRRRRKRNA